MKHFSLLFTLFICIILISGCNSGTSTVPTFTNTVGQTATPTNAPTTTSPSPQDYQVLVNTMLNNEPVNDSNTQVLTGNTLNIRSVLRCALDGLIGAPIIQIMDSNANIVVSWYLSEDFHMVSGLEFSQNYYPISSGIQYILDVTWDLKDMFTNVRVPPGQYTLQVTVYSDESNSFLPTNEGSFTLTLN